MPKVWSYTRDCISGKFFLRFKRKASHKFQVPKDKFQNKIQISKSNNRDVGLTPKKGDMAIISFCPLILYWFLFVIKENSLL